MYHGNLMPVQKSPVDHTELTVQVMANVFSQQSDPTSARFPGSHMLFYQGQKNPNCTGRFCPAIGHTVNCLRLRMGELPVMS
jgi:hypothetical protein